MLTGVELNLRIELVTGPHAYNGSATNSVIFSDNTDRLPVCSRIRIRDLTTDKTHNHYYNLYLFMFADLGGRAVLGIGVRPLGCWDRDLKSG